MQTAFQTRRTPQRLAALLHAFVSHDERFFKSHADISVSDGRSPVKVR